MASRNNNKHYCESSHFLGQCAHWRTGVLPSWHSHSLTHSPAQREHPSNASELAGKSLRRRVQLAPAASQGLVRAPGELESARERDNDKRNHDDHRDDAVGQYCCQWTSSSTRQLLVFSSIRRHYLFVNGPLFPLAVRQPLAKAPHMAGRLVAYRHIALPGTGRLSTLN